MSFGGGFSGFQGGGGGFMADESPSNMDSSQAKKKGQSNVQTLIPISAAMFHKADLDRTTDGFKFGNIELHQVTVLGIIREVQESATNMLYKIDDMTGDSITVRKWIDKEESQTEASRRSQCREDTYVRVYGNLKMFQETRSLVAFSMTPVKDFNEIPYHMIDVVHAYLTLTKGAEMSQANTSMAGGLRTPGGGKKAGDMSTTPLGGGTTGTFNSGQGSGLSGAPNQVLEAIVAFTDDQGISTDLLSKKLRNLNPVQIRNALDFLSNEGHIYSTIDEDHFRSTSM